MSNSRSQSAEEVQRSAGGSVAGGVWFNHARYDANGSVISGLSGLPGTYSYDVENRMVDNGVETYGYGAGNRRLWKKSTVSGSWAEVYLYGLRGEVLEVFRGTMGSPLERQSYTPTQRAWFGGRLIEKLGTAMNADRLGSYQGTYPYGELQGAVGTPGEKFGTYWRDATGLDYAVNRYYSSQMGRFLSADPYVASGGPSNPASWNRYAYVEGDPVNSGDPAGLQRWVITISGRACSTYGYIDDGGIKTSCQPWSISIFGGSDDGSGSVGEASNPTGGEGSGGGRRNGWNSRLREALNPILEGPCGGVFKQLGISADELRKKADSVYVVTATTGAVLNTDIFFYLGPSKYNGTVGFNAGAATAMTPSGANGTYIFLFRDFFGVPNMKPEDWATIWMKQNPMLVHELLHAVGKTNSFFRNNPNGLIFDPALAGSIGDSTAFITQWILEGCAPLKNIK